MTDEALTLEAAARYIEAALGWWEDNTPYDDESTSEELPGQAVLMTYTFLEGNKSTSLVYLAAVGALALSYGDTPVEQMKNAVAYLYEAKEAAQ